MKHAPPITPRTTPRRSCRRLASLAVLLCAVPAAQCGLAAAAEVDQAVLDAEAQRVAVIAESRQAAVAIFAASGQGGGSGVVISPDGYALSNFHVTKGAGDWMKCGMLDGRLYDAVIVGIDPVGDVALIKLFGRDDFPHARLGDSDQLRAGDWVFAVGNPFLLATDFHPTVTYGIVSGVHRYQYPSGTLLEYADCIQTDASINPGNSGGPLFDSQGLLVGINGRGSFEKRGRVNVGVAYAISINQIKKFLGCLKGGRIVDHATLGARLTSQDDGAVIVADVLESSDAYRRGLRYGDEVVGFGGRPIRTVNAFKNILGTFPKGWRVPLTFRRQGQTFDVLVRLSGVHGTEELLEKMQGQVPIDPPLPEPEKNPGEQPGDQPAPGPSDRPGDRPGDRRRPRPALPQREAARPMPDVVKQHFESKRGYANYYFNTLNRTRIHAALTAHGDFSSAAGEWLISGQLEGAGDAQFHVSDQQVSCALPGGELTLDASGDLTSATEPPGSGGLLAALYLWRRLLVLGPERFGSTYYYGTMPLAGHAEPVEVLVGTYGGVECQFMFDAQSGHLRAMEMFLDSDGDPCELYFFDYDKLDGRDLPRRLDVRYGDNVYAAFELVDFTLDKAPED